MWKLRLMRMFWNHYFYFLRFLCFDVNIGKFTLHVVIWLFDILRVNEVNLTLQTFSQLKEYFKEKDYLEIDMKILLGIVIRTINLNRKLLYLNCLPPLLGLNTLSGTYIFHNSSVNLTYGRRTLNMKKTTSEAFFN